VGVCVVLTVLRVFSHQFLDNEKQENVCFKKKKKKEGKSTNN
jgi:hypothetical protein